ncbi:isochorismate synthase [Acaryochloris sp. IP29b_bin.137]|uniref:isochorismate synthase n=1 Tax=Acaryochloris sp. IP29b_bin.137 TaxID=2969217 RepID=UPI002615B3E1|nr:isochorismate synthase [Acaryochloris sp. IP29b_bin.137]
MTVTSSSANLFQDRRSLQAFLASCRRIALDKEHAQVVSLSLEIPKQDPLAVLDLLQQPDHPYFYWEKQSQGVAIAATEPLLHLQVEGKQRFTQAQHFICTSLVDTVSSGALHLPFSGPHFFCGFTFFDQTVREKPFFPAASVFLPHWQVACFQDQAVLVANVVVDAETPLDALARSIWKRWQLLRTPRRCPSLRPQPTQLTYPKLINAGAFTTAVSDTLGLIEVQKLQKLVLAHTLDVITPQPLDLCHALGTLRERYPECYVFAVSNGQGQSFIGASPERLIELRDHHLITDALAGSAPRGLSLEDDQRLGNQLLGSQKDGHEHRVVLDFIRDSLWDLGITPQVASLPHLLQLPNIQHLRTLITAEVPQHLHLLEILAALHPTPAVAGMPRDVAQQQIQVQEAFERHLYAAPLGWMDYQGNGEFTVGIRSALINGSQARLYAGAGIVAGSDPQRELAEIQLKLHTLLDALL